MKIVRGGYEAYVAVRAQPRRAEPRSTLVLGGRGGVSVLTTACPRYLVPRLCRRAAWALRRRRTKVVAVL